MILGVFMDYDFKFSVVMPIYNVEKYLGEAIDSVINQSIGFEENVELIIVDDESPDNSKEIALKYQEKFPNNIKVFSKLNGGQASAFNFALEHINGKYVSFLDSDDYLSLNTFEEVYNYFEEHYDEIDLISIPIQFFERSDAQHMLNFKYDSTKIKDLVNYPASPQLSIASSFIKNEALKGMEFDTSLPHGYDALVVNKIILEKKKYGVIDTSTYFYRKRMDNTSMIDNTLYKKDSFTLTLKRFYLHLIEYCKEKEGHVPLFIQYVIVYDLKAFNIISDFPEDFTKEEINEFWETIYEVLSYIDEDIINNTKINRIENIRTFLIYLKNRKDFHVEVIEELEEESALTEDALESLEVDSVEFGDESVESDAVESVEDPAEAIEDEIGVFFKTGDFDINKLHHNRIYIDTINMEDGVLRLSGTVSNSSYPDALSIELLKTCSDGSEELFTHDFKDGSSQDCEVKRILGIDWHFKHFFDFEVPFNQSEETKMELHLIYDEDDKRLLMNNQISFRESALLSDKINYLVKDSLILYFSENSLNICPYSDEKLYELKQELLSYIKERLDSERGLKRENRSLNMEIERLNRKNQSLSRKNEKLKSRNEKLKEKNEKLNVKNQKLKESLKKSRDKNDELMNSTSWKITKPLRMSKELMHKKE